MKKLIYPDNYFITYAYYPGTNLIQTITDSNNIVQAIYTDYEPTGKIGQIDYHNGTATKYTYDAWSTKLFGIVTEDPTHDPLKLLQDREYTYSRAGDILQIVDHVQKVTYDYAYDKLHRLVSEKLSGVNAPIVTKVETITLDYTGTGPVHGVKTIDLNSVSRTCQYDANGNMVTSPDFTNSTNPLNRAITYDGDNMPTRIVHANGKTVDFVYDGTAKRTKKLVASGKTVLYLGDHFEVENGVNIKYIFGGNLRLAMIKGSLTSYFHKDHLGSTAAVTNAAGVKVESTTYEPFGSTRTQEGTPVSAYKFTDQELDNETNLYNYDARLYDPVLGMFVTPDSIMQAPFDPQMFNRYSYCRNNPLIYNDPSGHMVDHSGFGGRPTGHVTFDPITETITLELTGYGTKAWEARNNVVAIDKQGKSHTPQDPGFHSDDLNPVNGPPEPRFGPTGCYLDTGNPDGKDLHGGGTGLPNPYADYQGWVDTYGCVRMQNYDIKTLSDFIKEFKKQYPGIKVPYDNIPSHSDPTPVERSESYNDAHDAGHGHGNIM